MLLNLRSLVFFSSKQDFVCCKFSFKGLPWDLQTKVLRVLWTIQNDVVAKSALEKAFKKFMKSKASLTVPILFRWSPRFPRHDTSTLLLPIFSKSDSANNLFKLYKASPSHYTYHYNHSVLILIHDISNLIFVRITFDESLTVLLVPTCRISADGFFLVSGTELQNIFY